MDCFHFLDFEWFVKRIWMPVEKALCKLFIIVILKIEPVEQAMEFAINLRDWLNSDCNKIKKGKDYFQV